MRKLIQTIAVTAMLLAGALPISAATPAEFYASLLRRGVAEFDAGRLESATRLLRLAAFGFVDTVEQYEVAQAYLAVAYDRLGDAARARDAATRIIRAERVERRFARASLPADVRAQFDRVAARLLTAAEVAALRSTEPLPPLRQPQTTTAATPATQPQTPPSAADRAGVEVTRGTTTTTPARPQTADGAAAGTNGEPRPSVAGTTQPPAQRPAVIPDPPRSTTPTTTRPATQTPAQPATTQPRTPAASTTNPTTTPRPAAMTASEIASRLAAAERALIASNLPEARRLYREVLSSTTVDRATAIDLGEGLYRARDFAGALEAFTRAGALRPGEEPYRYYIAVALYETGRYRDAQRELAAALPHIELTPDVARYRERIATAAD